ncbi:Protein SnodProt1 [Colletotrichum trifolii]|uniref:Protein SnodProt1 n=1 Tax=Colletotrichum trifolii TaxID=5466 RepID=A0A4R8RRU9_COLTR|nr:Protein SnodProt1 [Colletotrichum trifolii]
MRLSIISATVAYAAIPAMALRVSLKYDAIYEQGKRSLSEVACWNPNVPGLFPDHDDWLLQENIAPGILAMPSITGWDHPDCITCWMVTWEEGRMTRMLLAIDGSEDGFVTSRERMNSLTNGKADDFNPLEPLIVTAPREMADERGRKETSDEL